MWWSCWQLSSSVPDYFVTSKIIENIFTAFYANENILCFNERFGDIVFICSEMDILNIDLNNINLDNNFDVDNLDTVILITRMKLFYRKLFSTRREYRYHWKEWTPVIKQFSSRQKKQFQQPEGSYSINKWFPIDWNKYGIVKCTLDVKHRFLRTMPSE